MAERIVILDQVGMPSDLNYRVAFWLDVPTERQKFYANPAATSVVVGIQAQDLTAIRSGAVKEEVEIIPQVIGAPFATVRQAARARAAARQAEFNRDNAFNRYGTYWNGTAWTDVTVA